MYYFFNFKVLVHSFARLFPLHLFDRLIFQSIEPNHTYTGRTQFFSFKHCDIQISVTPSCWRQRKRHTDVDGHLLSVKSLFMTDWMNMSFNVNLFPCLKPPNSNSSLWNYVVTGSMFHTKVNLKHLYLCWPEKKLPQPLILISLLFWAWYAWCFLVNICILFH